LYKPKHTKKDYDVLNDISVSDIINSSVIAPKKKELEVDSLTYSDMVKIKEKKKKLR